MKRNKIAKRLGIASICLVTAFSAFSGLTSLIDKVAFADTSVKELVETTVAKENVTQDASGLLLSSDAAYDGTFKTIFTGNTALNFKFSEKYEDKDGNELPDEFYGDFRFRITDATDESKFFDVVHFNAYYQNTSSKVDYYATGVYVQYGNEVRAGSSDTDTKWFNYAEDKNYMFNRQSFVPSFKRYSGNNDKRKYDGEKIGEFKLVWTEDGLAVQELAQWEEYWYTRTIAKFDGTYDPNKKDNGFVSGESWGLPKINFENGYKISFSSNITQENADDHGTDVLFTSISTDGEMDYDEMDYRLTYDFSRSTVPKDSYMKAYDALSRNDVFVGWKHTQKDHLYATYNDVRDDFDSYEALVIEYETLVDALSGGFKTVLKKDGYDKIAEYIIEVGTLVAPNESLIAGLDFTIENYQDVIDDPDGYVKTVEFAQDLVDYTDKKTGKAYKAYSLAIADVAQANGAVTYSARGYLVVKCRGNVKHTVYTDYDPAFNSLSID